MRFPIATGQAARLLATTEPQLAELVRRGRIQPPPVIFAGRRLWEAEHVRMAAILLGIHADSLEVRLQQDVPEPAPATERVQ